MSREELEAKAGKLGLDVDRRWNDATLKRKIGDAEERLGETPEEMANRKNETGKTNPEDFVKNETEPGPGNPDQRIIDPAVLTDAQPVDVRENIIADTAYSPEGEEMDTEETPKVTHETVTVASREITNNTIADMSKRPPLVIEAETLGIYVDPSWDDQRLQREINMAKSGRADLQVKGAIPGPEFDNPQQAQQSPGGVPVKFLRDYWGEEKDGQEQRWSSGMTGNLPTKEARRLMDSGVVERADKLPGE